MDFNEFLQNFVNKDYDELVYIAKKAIVELQPACAAVDKDNDGFFMMTSIVLTAIGADGTLTQKERALLRDVLSVDDETISKYIKLYDSKMVDLVDSFADSLSTEIKSHVMMLVLSIMCSDEKISKEETALIKKLLA